MLRFDFEEELERMERERYELLRHAIPKRKQPVVCLHWLRGMCHKNEHTCERLHVYDQSLLPLCHFFIKNECTNPDCMFRHPVHESEEVYCIAYAKGFCARGEKCSDRHLKYADRERANIRHNVRRAMESHQRARDRSKRYQNHHPLSSQSKRHKMTT